MTDSPMIIMMSMIATVLRTGRGAWRFDAARPPVPLADHRTTADQVPVAKVLAQFAHLGHFRTNSIEVALRVPSEMRSA